MNIFTYGSLMVPSIFKSVTGRDFRSQPGCISDYGRFALRHDSYPGIIEAEGYITEGIIYFDVDEASVSELDEFEGEYYRRTPVCVKLDIKSFIDAETYVIKQEYRHSLSSREWDFEEFKKKFQNEFTRKYVGSSSIKTKEDSSSP
jgi:gamma-glutamylcyclotransferase (GGCT)/AIG2-like uncharacterized protein YtfP